MFRGKSTVTTLALVVVLGSLFVLDGVVERLSVLLGRRVQDQIETTERDFQVTFEDVPEPVAEGIDFNYLLVRYGTNELLSQDPSSGEKAKMRLRNREIDVRQSYDATRRTLTVTIPVRTHRTLPTEFKLFADVTDQSIAEEAIAVFEDNEICADASGSDLGNPNRFYVLLESLGTTTSPEGLTNNVIYPR